MADLSDARGAAFSASVLSEHHWVCPNCDATHVTLGPQVQHTPFHPCRGLRGLMAPFVGDRTKAKIVAVEREDYVGSELVTTDDEGRPVMAVVTTRDDGEDCAILAPTAQGDLHGMD